MTNKRLTVAIAAASFAVLVAAVLAVQPLIAQAKAANSTDAANQVRYFAKTSGKTAWTNWYVEDLENGTLTDAYIVVSDRTERTNYYRSPIALVEASVNQYRLEEVCEEEDEEDEYCYYAYVRTYSFYGQKELSKSDFSIANNLASARLDTEIVGYEYRCEEEDEEDEYCPEQDPIAISINATWTGFGETYKGRDRYSSNNEYSRVTAYATGFFKQATAEVNILGENIDLHLDENSNYGEAYLSKNKDGYIMRINYR
jgi:hypothetical protein